jgi:dienelactone hydrolase
MRLRAIQYAMALAATTAGILTAISPSGLVDHRRRVKGGGIKTSFAWVALLLIGIAGDAYAQILELRPVETVTLSTEQFLTGSTSDSPATLGGELRIPTTGTDRIPAVILIHGGSGVTPMIERWAQEINDIGMASFVIDSYSGRGIPGSKVDSMAMMIDAFSALGVLALHPRIDPDRIAIMGTSKGALAALYSSNERFRLMYAPPHMAFAAHIALYAPCMTIYRDDDKVTGKPIRMFHGVADELFSVEACRAYVARLKKSGADVVLTEFPDAGHAFDAFVLKRPLTFPKGKTLRNCRLVEGDAGQILNSATGNAFDVSDPCVGEGFAFAYNEAAATATTDAVKAFLVATFKRRP